MTEETSSERWRLFVAVTIPDPVRNEIIAIQRELKPVTLGVVRWTDADQLHVTLKFLGNIPIGSVAGVKQALDEACAGGCPFLLRAKGIGFFPNARSPSVIWVGFEDDDYVLPALQLRVERLLAPFVENPSTEIFRAHATLGRFQKYRRHKTERFIARAHALANCALGEWQVKDVGLFRSELRPNGARHALLAAYPLGESLKTSII